MPTRNAIILLGLSAGLCLALWLGYGLQPDAAAALGVWPVWVWPAPGLALVALAALANRGPSPARRSSGWWLVGVAGLWLVFLLALAEEPWSLLRGLGREPARSGSVRVVSFNCGLGDAASAAEVARYRPDLVLLQEAPEPDQVATLARRLFGPEAGWACELDRAVLARGRVRARPRRGRVPYAYSAAQVELAGGLRVEVLNVHLLPPLPKFNLLSPSCWREHAARRRSHRLQVEETALALRALPAGMPVIAAGDWNLPAGAGPLRLLTPRARDAFRQAGRGWGNTVLNDFPVQRIDQVWVGGPLRPRAVWGRQSKRSDHRLVVCDLEVGR